MRENTRLCDLLPRPLRGRAADGTRRNSASGARRVSPLGYAAQINKIKRCCSIPPKRWPSVPGLQLQRPLKPPSIRAAIRGANLNGVISPHKSAGLMTPMSIERHCSDVKPSFTPLPVVQRVRGHPVRLPGAQPPAEVGDAAPGLLRVFCSIFYYFS